MKVIYSILPKFAGGGTGNIAYHTVREIYKRGYLKKLITASYRETEIDSSLITTVPVRDIPVVWRTSWGSGLNYVIRDNIFDFLSSFKIEECDIYHCWSHPSLFSLRKARSKGAKIILQYASTHILAAEQILSKEYDKYGFKYKPFHPLHVRKVLREIEETDYILVPSRWVYDTFLKHGVPEKKLLLVPFSVDLDRFKPGRKKDDIFRVLFSGQLSLRKGAQYVLQAWSELNLKNSELVLMGNVQEQVKPIIKKYQGKMNFKITGAVSDPVPYYQQASVFVFPSIEEGSALVNYEALACGLPSITTPNSGAQGIVRDGQEGFIVPMRNVEALKEKIRFLHEHPGEREKMSKSALEHIKNYSQDVLGSNIERIYREVLKS